MLTALRKKFKVPMSDPPRNLNTHRIEAALTEKFPGVKFDVRHGLSTQRWESQIWEFYLMVSLQAKRVTYVDGKPGTGFLTFIHRFENSQKTLMSEAIETEEQLIKKLTWCRGYLLGVLEVITRALDEPPPPPLADIFGGTHDSVSRHR